MAAGFRKMDRLGEASKERLRREYAELPRRSDGAVVKGFVLELARKWGLSAQTLYRCVGVKP